MRNTPNYNLPQYDGTDKFTKEVLNDAFSKVDTAISDLQETFNTTSTGGALTTQEVINARNGKQNLKERIDEIDEQYKDIVTNDIPQLQGQMDNIIQQQYKTDNTLDVINIPLDKSFSLEYLQSEQNRLYGIFYRNLRKKIPQTVCCQGDSVTYGHDTVSLDKRSPMADGLCENPSNGTHTNNQASVTYPEALQGYLNEVYGNGIVTVKNRGYSGDATKYAYNDRWKKSSGANLTIMAYGINDSRASWVEYKGDIAEYLKWYEKLICREILRGSAVILLTPIKQQMPTDIDVDTFSNSLILLGEKYNVPVIIGDELLANYSASIFSDGTHLNGVGYRILASKIMAIFIGEGIKNKRYVSHGSKLLARPTVDNISFKNVSFSPSSGFDTPDESEAGKGIALQFNTIDGAIYYSFYSEIEDLILVPHIYNYNCDVKFELDFGVRSAEFTCDEMVDSAVGFNDNARNTFTLSTTSAIDYVRKNMKINDTNYIHIPTKGWHTLKITCTRVGNYSALKNIEFLQYDVFKSCFRKGYYELQVTNESTSVIPILDIINSLNIKEVTDMYWKGQPLKIVINNYNQSVLEYVFTLGNTKLNTDGWKWCSTPTRYNLTTSPTNERTISNITYEASTKDLTITWSGVTTRQAECIIKIA